MHQTNQEKNPFFAHFNDQSKKGHTKQKPTTQHVHAKMSLNIY